MVYGGIDSSCLGRRRFGGLDQLFQHPPLQQALIKIVTEALFHGLQDRIRGAVVGKPVLANPLNRRRNRRHRVSRFTLYVSNYVENYV